MALLPLVDGAVDDTGGDLDKYPLRTIATADGDRELSTSSTRYYVESGTPQGSESSPVLISLILRFLVYSAARACE